MVCAIIWNALVSFLIAKMQVSHGKIPTRTVDMRQEVNQNENEKYTIMAFTIRQKLNKS
jgi:hypothetical protein